MIPFPIEPGQSFRRYGGSPLAIAAFLLLGAAPGHAAPDLCEREAANDPYIAPIPVVEFSRDYIALADDIVAAHEVALVARHGWLLADPLRLNSPEALVYPAGTPLEPEVVNGIAALCLPVARRPVAARPGDQGRLFQPNYYKICLTDTDHDGLHESVDVFTGNSAMHVIRHHLVETARLAVPQRLVPDPLGLASSRRYVHRRITAAIRGAAEPGKELRLRVTHAWQDHDRRSPPGEWSVGADGTPVYRLLPQRPPPVVMTGYNYRLSDKDPTASVTIADGAEITVGGLRFRLVQRSGGGWALQPLDRRSPSWIHYGCDGKSVELGFRAAKD